MRTFRVHEACMACVHVPAYLGPSLRLALPRVHGPFFAAREVDGVEVVLREEEWDRLAARFTSAVVTRGFRLLSVEGLAEDPADGVRLTTSLTALGIRGTLLASFYGTHVLIPAEDLTSCIAALSS